MKYWFVSLLIFACATAWARNENAVHFEGNMPAHVKEQIELASQPVINTARLEDDGDVQQLFRRLRPVLRDVLGTQGYFSATIRRQPVDETSKSGRFEPNLTISIEPGPRSIVQSVDIQFEGAINSPQFDERRKLLAQSWLLDKGQPFRQSEWANSKSALLRNLLAKDFADATIAESEANVDPDTNTVQLKVVYDSGPVFTFGKLNIQGLHKYPADLVSRFNTIEPGDRYEQERLLSLLSDLQNTDYFSSVDVKINRDAKEPQEVPIDVTVTESKSKRLGLGAGYSSNTGFRTEASYRYNNLFDHAYTLVSGVRLEQKRQSAYTDFYLPPTQRGVLDSFGVAVDHQSLSNLDLQRTSLGVLREYQLGVTDIKLGINFQLEARKTPTLDLGNTKALVASGSWNKSLVDDKLNPRRGYVMFAQAAVASAHVLSDQDFIKLNGKVQRFWSPTRKDLITARLELGTVIAGTAQDIPQDYLFRTGGTNSVRGYKFLDIGVLSNGVIVGGRRLFVGSLEYTRWLNGPFGVSVFSDLGDVANSWGLIRPKPSVGFGLRYKTPAGPISLDFAKARDQKNIRIHFALGVAF